MSRFVRVRYLVVIVAIFVLIYLGFVVTISQPTFATAPSCLNLLQNSNMEGGGGWIFGLTPALGYYATTQYVSPSRSAHLGITTGPNITSYSSMRQIVSVPPAAPGQTLRLRLQIKPISQPFDAGDGQEILIMDASGMTTLRTLWSATSNANAWQSLDFDVSEFMGQTIMVYINVYNNGVGGRTAMFVDDVYLEVCGGVATATPTPGFVTATPTPTSGFVTATPTSGFVTATPTPGFITATPTSGFVTATPTFIVVTNTPTPTITPNFVTATPTFIVVTNTPTQPPGFITATPTPTAILPIPSATPTSTPFPPGACVEMLLNTSFENWQGWYFGKTVLQPGYVGDNPHTGYRSVLLGNAYADRPNYKSYSSVRQRVSLPREPFLTAYLEFWRFTASDLEPDDYQELVILDARGKTLAVLWRDNLDERQWRYRQFDVTRFLGKSIYVYFNVRNRNNLGRASMYVDDVSLKICSGVTMEGGAPSGGQPLLQATPPGVVFVTTTPVTAPTTELMQPEFATAAPSSSPTQPSPLATTTTDAKGQVVASPTPTTTPEILATPTPLGAEKLIPETTKTGIWQFARQALWYAFWIIVILVLGFLVYRIVAGWKKRKKT